MEVNKKMSTYSIAELSVVLPVVRFDSPIVLCNNNIGVTTVLKLETCVNYT